MAWLLRRLTTVTLVIALAITADAMPTEPSVRLPVTVVGEPRPESVVVAPGDHLWKISETRLLGELGREATEEELRPYWLEVIDLNTSRLRSGDPDLIYPGEIVELPAR